VDLLKIRALRNVRRFNFEHCIHYQSVAEHSFFVALITRELVKVMNGRRPFPSYPDTCMESALLHDLTESVLGDIPYLVRKNMDIKALADLEGMAERELDIVHDMACPSSVANVVEYADALELALYLKEERELGNTTLIDIEKETWGRLVVMLNGEPAPEFVWASELLGISTFTMTSNQKEIHSGLKH